MQGTRQNVLLVDIARDPRLQPRAALDAETVEDYAARYAEGIELPPVTLFHDGATHWLADGNHRVVAAGRANLTAIPADVRQGTFRDALLFAAGANAGHGLRRTNADKRRAVEMLLTDVECANWSDSEIGKHCSVDHKTVATVRIGILGNSQDANATEPAHLGKSPDIPVPATRTVTRGGRTYTMRVGNIGRRSPPAPKTPAKEPSAGRGGLIHCPFCGYEDEIRAIYSDESRFYTVYCCHVDCGAAGPQRETEAEALEAWNQRV